MSNNNLTNIDQMKESLLELVYEWLGMDIPEEGTEDFIIWQSKLMEIDAIQTKEDVINYLESEGYCVEDFFESENTNFGE